MANGIGVFQRRQNSPIIIAQSGVAASITGTLTETTLATITVPGGMMGPNGAIRVRARYGVTANTNGKTFRVKYGGTTFASPGTIVSTAVGFALVITIQNRGVTNSQVGDGDSAGTSAMGVSYTGSVNSTIDQSLIITGTLGNVADTITLEGYTVEVLPSA